MKGEPLYTDAQNKAGNAALEALREAERRARPKPTRGKPPDPPAAVPAPRCVYCGQRTRSKKRPATCALHADLPALDPHYRA